MQSVCSFKFEGKQVRGKRFTLYVVKEIVSGFSIVRLPLFPLPASTLDFLDEVASPFDVDSLFRLDGKSLNFDLLEGRFASFFFSLKTIIF